jgi:hypothetical protein
MKPFPGERHGHVTALAGGKHARCGGPALCFHCRYEKLWQKALDERTRQRVLKEYQQVQQEFATRHA